jgi:hypothetical protein
MKPLIDYYISEFYQYGESALKSICNLNVPKKVFLDAYKRIPPIPDDEVGELMQYANEMYPEKNEEEKTEIIKVVYTLGTLL